MHNKWSQLERTYSWELGKKTKQKNFDLDAPCVSDTNYTVSQSTDNYTALDQQECNHQTNRR